MIPRPGVFRAIRICILLLTRVSSPTVLVCYSEATELIEPIGRSDLAQSSGGIQKRKKREVNVHQIPERRSSHCSTDLSSKPVPFLRLSLAKSYPQGQRRRMQGFSHGQCHGFRTHLTFGLRKLHPTSRFSAKNDKKAQLVMTQVIIKLFPPVDVGGVELKFHCHGGNFLHGLADTAKH